jgi:hypothetical protein
MAAANGLQIGDIYFSFITYDSSHYHFNFDRMIQCGLTRNNATHINALIWFQEHFARCGEPPPNGKGLHPEVMDKKNIYFMYLTAGVERISPREQEDGKKRILQRPADEKELAGAANLKANRTTTAKLEGFTFSVFEGEKVTKQLLPDA